MSFIGKTKKVLLCMMLLTPCYLLPGSVYARESMRALPTDGRIKVVAYEKDNVVPVKVSTFTTTQITFDNNEVIENIQNGDLDAWTVSVEKGLKNMVFLKPTILGSNTNMTVVTNKRVYYFHLNSFHSKSKEQLDTTYAIEFVYPRERTAKLNRQLTYKRQQKRAIIDAKQNPKHYNWNYSFSGSHSIMPIHVFDDGRFTYLQLQPHQAIPAIFSVDNKGGQEALVNYRRQGQYLVVQQIAPQFTLREGKHAIASIFNNGVIARMQSRAG